MRPPFNRVAEDRTALGEESTDATRATQDAGGREAWRLEDAVEVGHSAYQGALFQEPTFFQLAEWYRVRARRLTRRERTIKSEDSYIGQALEWLRREGISRPTTATWKAYLDYRLSPECCLSNGKAGRLTPRSADSHRSVLGRVYRRCRDIPDPSWHMVPNPLDSSLLGPCHAGGRDQPRSLAEPYVTYPQLQMAMPDVVAKAFISLMRWHGLRVQEALAVPMPGSPADIKQGGRVLDLNAGTLRIECQRTRDSAVDTQPLKTEYSKAKIKLAPEPARLLREALTWRSKLAVNAECHHRKYNGVCARNFVFPYFKYNLDQLLDRHRQVSPLDFRLRVRGVDGADGFHVYRHTFAVEHYKRVLEGHMPKEELHRLLRHRNPKTTDLYLNALNVEVLGTSSAVEESWRIQEELQARAIQERTGKGPMLVQPQRMEPRARPGTPTPAVGQRRALSEQEGG